MESRLKERLTGAAILVALVVLVVPEMFRGPQSAGSAGVAAATHGPPMRSYTIDLTHSAAATPASGSAADLESSPPAAPTAGEQASPAAVEPHPAVVQAPALQAPAPAPERRIHAPATAGPRSTATTPGSARASWSVQLGLFTDRANAQRLAQSARKKGFSARIARTQPRGLYRVWIAGLADRTAAERMSRKLHAAGLAAAVMRPR